MHHRDSFVDLVPPTGLRFNGEGYAALDTRNGFNFERQFDLQLNFKTYAEDGILFMITGGPVSMSEYLVRISFSKCCSLDKYCRYLSVIIHSLYFISPTRASTSLFPWRKATFSSNLTLAQEVPPCVLQVSSMMVSSIELKWPERHTEES